MAYVVTLEGFTPSPRYPPLATPWTEALIQESATETGTFATVDTVTLSPVDTDPTHPQERNFTTTAATLPAGWYRVVFRDAAANQETAGPVFSGPEQTASWRPSLRDVADYLQVRIVDAGGNFLEVWTADTTPTAAQIQTKIDRAVRDVRRDLGPELETTTDTDLIGEARDLAAMRAAMFVELSFYPQRLDSEESVYAGLKVLYDEGIARLRSSLRTDPGDDQGFGSVAVMSPTAAAHMDRLAGLDPWTA
jgi:hypothetical protein